MRVKNASPRVSFRHMNVREVSLYPQSSKDRYDGEREHVDVGKALQQVVDDLRFLYDNPQPYYNGFTGKTEHLRVVCTTVMADSPARSKITRTGATNSHLPCTWCPVQSTAVSNSNNSGRTLYPAGYNSPIVLDRFACLDDVLYGR